VSTGSLGPVGGRIRNAARPISLFVGTALAGVVGFVTLTGITVVDAAFWLLDPTSIELYFESHEGPEQRTKAFALGVFAVLILSGLWIGESVLDTVFGGQFGEELRRVQTQQAIADLDGHVVVCGYGMFGRTVAERLLADGTDVVVIERDPEVFERIESGMLAIQGDARREEVLVEAGVERARAVVAAVDNSNLNIQSCIVSSQLAPDARLVVRVGEEMYESLAMRAGADAVVIPEVVSGTDVVEKL
jgi:K+ transport systems, NAD-binding component